MIPERLIYKKGEIYFLDQRYLPHKIKYLKTDNIKQAHKAIKDMVLRGAPLIGCAAAYSFILGLKGIKFKKIEELKISLEKISDFLKTARPTAVSLHKISDRMLYKSQEFLKNTFTSKGTEDILKELREYLEKEALKIVKEDIDSTRKMSEYGVKLLPDKAKVITYCNTGELATMGIGTALGVINRGYKEGKIKFVYACETRPYLQGARLTIWELKKNKIPSALITDNMAGHIMKTEKIDAILIGADRIAANGDTANKIGSYMLAILARYHKIPFYVIAPTDTIDLTINSGDKIKIEERQIGEVIKIKNFYIAPPNIKARHPAFDITPSALITAIVTEKGIIKPVNSKNILKNLKIKL